MEIQKITYDTKKYIRNDPNYPKTQTITDEDMNEIKSVVNNNAYKQDEDYLKLKNAALNAETEESKSIHVEDASTIGQLEVLGNHEQDGEPSPENEVPVICLGSNTDGTFKGSTEIIKTNKNMLCKPKNSIVTGRGLTVNYNEGKFIINGTTTGTYIKLDKELKVDAFQNTGSWSKNSVLNPGSYMFSIKTISGTSSSTNVNLYIRNTTDR